MVVALGVANELNYIVILYIYMLECVWMFFIGGGQTVGPESLIFVIVW